MSITIANNDETTEKAMINIKNEETQPESGEVSPDEEAQQYEQKEEEYDEEAIEKNLLLYLKRLNILRNEIIMQYKQNVTEFTAAFENVKYIEKCDKRKENELDMLYEQKVKFTSALENIKYIEKCNKRNAKLEKYNAILEKIKHIVIEGSKYEQTFENIVELCETYPHLNSKIISLEELRNILHRIGANLLAREKSNEKDLEQYEKDRISENFAAPDQLIDKKLKIEIVYVSDRISNSWRPYILSSTFFLISIIFPLFCYAMYIILLNTHEIFNINPYMKEIFNINPYIKEMFYEASYVSSIAACLFQLSTFNWQILKRIIFISEAGSNFLYLAMMIIARSLFLYYENDLNTIDYISVFLEFVALFLLICATSGFDAWHVDKKRKLIILIGVNIILLYQYIKNSLKSVSHDDKFISKEFINITIITARFGLIGSFLRQLWCLIRRWNSNGAIAVITDYGIMWVNDKDIDRLSSYKNGFSGSLICIDECAFFIPKFVVIP